MNYKKKLLVLVTVGFITLTSFVPPERFFPGESVYAALQDGRYPYYLYCNQYVEVQLNIALLYTCPSGLLYHDKILVCIEPEFVDCGNRKIP